MPHHAMLKPDALRVMARDMRILEHETDCRLATPLVPVVECPAILGGGPGELRRSRLSVVGAGEAVDDRDRRGDD